MRFRVLPVLGLLAFGGPAYASSPPHTEAPARITILYDAFGGAPGLTQDWGFAALIEYQGHRILFDTGDNAAIFEHNVRALHVDLRHLDFAVISHRHGDHIAGLSYLLRVNPQVRIYAPRESFGVFGSALPPSFYRTDPALPRNMRYFNGTPEAELRFGTAWPRAHFILIDTLTEVLPGVSIVATVSRTPGTLELRAVPRDPHTKRGGGSRRVLPPGHRDHSGSGGGGDPGRGARGRWAPLGGGPRQCDRAPDDRPARCVARTAARSGPLHG